MKQCSVLLALLLAVPGFAATSDDCSGSRALGALYEIRNVLLRPYSSSFDVDRIIDRRIEELRVPTGKGSYRWVAWVRPQGEPAVRKEGHLTVAVHDRGDSDAFEASSLHVYAVRVSVPDKRSLFKGNNRVYVGGVHITYDSNGRSKSKDERIDRWMNRDTAKTIDLGGIADHVRVQIDASADVDHVEESLVEIQFEVAVAEDDPANPDYDVIQSLMRVRSSGDVARAVDEQIGRLEHELFSASSQGLPLLQIVADLRRADDLMRSKKDADVDKGKNLLRDTLRRLR